MAVDECEEDNPPKPSAPVLRSSLAILRSSLLRRTGYGGWKGGYASADSAEEHGGTTGFARGAPGKMEK